MTDQPKSLYQILVAIGAEIDSHASDLYVKSTPEVLALVQLSEKNYSTFKSNIDGETWIDIPFAYDPFWEMKLKQQPEPKAADLPTMLTMFGLAPELLKEPQPEASAAPLVFQRSPLDQDCSTPPPWIIVGNEIHDRPTHFDDHGARIGETANLIATVHVMPRGHQRKNLFLISAAPELLDALNLAVATIERLQTVRAGGFSSASGTLEVAKAAIAKATGKESLKDS